MSKGNRRRGHVRRRGAHSFQAVWWDTDPSSGKRRQRGKTFATPKEAERHLTAVHHALDTGSYAEPDRKTQRVTLREFVEEHWLPGVRASVRPSTFESYRSNLDAHVLAALGGMQLRQVTPERLNTHYAELLERGRHDGGRLSPRTVRYIHVILRRCLADAVRWNWISQNPADAADPPRAERSEQAHWTPAQLGRFVGHVADDRLAGLWQVLATLGIRRGEALGLRWSGVDLERGAITITQTLLSVGYRVHTGVPKTEKGRRRIGLDAALVAALRAHRARQAQERLAAGELWGNTNGLDWLDGDVDATDLVFTDELGRPLHPMGVSQAFARLAAAADLPRIRLHDLRHSVATALLADGVPARLVADRLGHSSTQITNDIYGHTTPELDSRVAERMAELLYGDQPTMRPEAGD